MNTIRRYKTSTGTMASTSTKADSDKKDDNRITFARLLKGEKGIVCNKAEYVGRKWNCSDAEDMLIKRVDDIKDEIGKEKISEYYIGKTFVDATKGRDFNEQSSGTWDLKGINKRWGDPRYKGYNGLIFLTVIRTVKYNFTHEDFALALEQRLIHHYKIDRKDAKIKNPTFNEGKRAGRGGKEDDEDEEDKEDGHPGYAVYIAVKIEEGGGRGR